MAKPCSNFGWCNFEYGMHKSSGYQIKACVRLKRKGLEAEIIKFWIKTILVIYKIKVDWPVSSKLLCPRKRQIEAKKRRLLRRKKATSVDELVFKSDKVRD